MIQNLSLKWSMFDRRSMVSMGTASSSARIHQNCCFSLKGLSAQDQPIFNSGTHEKLDHVMWNFFAPKTIEQLAGAW